MAPDGPRAARPERRPTSHPAFAACVAIAFVVVVSSSCATTARDGSASTTPVTSSRTDGTAAVLAEPAEPDPSTPPADAVPGMPPASSAPDPTTTTVPVPVPYPIGTVELDLVDPSRATISRGTTVAPSRSLPTVVAYPTGTGGPWPLVVFAHGFRLGPPGYARLVGVLAAAGYVVAAPSFPLADESVAGSQVDRGDLPNQPRDVSFVIDQVLATAADPTSPLAGRVDGGRIGAVGHSDGADTVLDIGYHPDRADPRVAAVVALSPDAVVSPGGVGGSTPLLVEHGDADTVVPYAESVSVFTTVTARRYLLTLLGAGHLDPVTAPTTWTPVLDQTVTAFLDHFVAGSTDIDGAVTSPASASRVARIEVAG